MSWTHLSLEAQLAQRLMIGYAPGDPWFESMLTLGLGGVIFFRHDFDTLAPQQAVKTLLTRHIGLHGRHNPDAPILWLGLDQEGGQVERLPQSWFPAGLSPQAVASVDLARPHYAMLAQSLTALGFNLDFFPTLDVNLTPDNPIIGIRAFGDDPATVWRNGQAALEAFTGAGVVPVIKHFPGHGNGTVDSHERLPTLTFSAEELEPFRQAIDWGAPVVMVSHGHYPALDPIVRPATLSPVISTGLLREQLGFAGVSITDDMEMGAVWNSDQDPVETALAALNAGMDMLLYRHGDQATLGPVWEGLLAAARAGRLDVDRHHAALERIARIKQKTGVSNALSTEQVECQLRQAQETASQHARQALAVSSPLINQAEAHAIFEQTRGLPWTLILPDAQHLPHYGYDLDAGHPGLETVLKDARLPICDIHYYSPETEKALVKRLLSDTAQQPSRLLVASWLPKVGLTVLQALSQALSQCVSNYPLRLHAPIGVKAAPWVEPALFYAEPNLHSYRQPHHEALAQWLLAIDHDEGAI